MLLLVKKNQKGRQRARVNGSSSVKFMGILYGGEADTVEREMARTISSYIQGAADLLKGKYSIEIVAPEGEELQGLHNFVDGREQVGTFIIQQIVTEKTYYFVLPDFLFSGIFYLVIYPNNRSNPLLCMHKVEGTDAGRFNLCWTYVPTRRDGRNFDRKNLFAKGYRGQRTELQIPQNLCEVEIFLDEIFRLCEARICADNLCEHRAE